MGNFGFWQRWLFIVSLIVIVFGLFMAFLSGSAFFELFGRQVDPIFWNGGEPPADARHFQTWVYGVLGATVVGWGIFMAFIAYVPFRNREGWAWYCLLIGLIAWYSIDTFISIISGVQFNALFNTVLLVLIGLPLLFSRKEFMPRR